MVPKPQKNPKSALYLCGFQRVFLLISQQTKGAGVERSMPLFKIVPTLKSWLRRFNTKLILTNVRFGLLANISLELIQVVPQLHYA